MPLVPRAARWLGALAALVAVASVGAAAEEAPDALNGFSLAGLRVPRAEVVAGGPPRDGIRSVDAPSFVAVSEAPWVAPHNPVLGLAIEDGGVSEAVVAPIHLIERHQIVNAVVGGAPVAITYDPLLAAPRAYRRTQGDRVLTFGVSGLIYNHGFLMYDRETESLWSQFTGEAIAGPLAGERLASLPIHQQTLAMWLEREPEAKVLVRPMPEKIDYRHSPFDDYMLRDDTIFPVHAEDRAFHLKELVLGVRVGDRTRAYLGSRATAAGGAIEDAFEGRPIRLLYDTNTAVWAYDVPDDVRVEESYWLGWKAFHPDTDVWRAGEAAAP